MRYTEVWANVNTEEIVVREPYKVIRWAKEGEIDEKKSKNCSKNWRSRNI